MHTILVVETFTAQDREYSVNIFHKFLSLFISQPHVLLSMRWRCNFCTKKKKDERDKNLLNRIDQIYRRENIWPNHQKRLTLWWFRKKISVSTRTTKILQIASEKFIACVFLYFFKEIGKQTMCEIKMNAWIKALIILQFFEKLWACLKDYAEIIEM